MILAPQGRELRVVRSTDGALVGEELTKLHRRARHSHHAFHHQVRADNGVGQRAVGAPDA
eukprot:scaffold65010_cov83-Phaeocystis_antarctica.AAC.1